MNIRLKAVGLIVTAFILIPPASATATDSPVPISTAALFGQHIQQETLANGLRVVVIKNTLAPVVTTQLNYLVGAAQSPHGFSGTAHAVEHMMFQSNRAVDKYQLSVINTQLGDDYNAFTGDNMTQYYYTVPAKDLELVLKIEAARMQGLKLIPQEWQTERGAIKQEIAANWSDPLYRYAAGVRRQLFHGTPYASTETQASMDQTDVALLHRFYQSYYAPNNAILVIAGNIDPNRTLQRVRHYFAPMAAKKLPAPTQYHFQPVKATTLHMATTLPAGLISLAWRMPGQQAANYAVADILSDIMSSQRNPLYALVLQNKALAIGFNYHPMQDTGWGALEVQFATGTDEQALLHDIQSRLNELCTQGITTELVENARNRKITALNFASNSTAELATLWTNTLVSGKGHSPADLLTAYQRVTPEQVSQLANSLFTPQHTITSILTPAQAKPAIYQTQRSKKESFAPKPDKPVILPAWAQQILNRLNLPDDRPRPADMTLKNGIRLIVQPTSINNTISVYGRIQQNPALQEANGKEGLADITNNLFNFGSQHLNQAAFLRESDAIAADIEAGSQFSLAVLARHFDRGMQLLADNQLHPAFNQHNFTLVRNQYASTLRGLYQTPEYQFSKAIFKAINPPQDPVLRQADPQKVMQLTLEDVTTFYRQAYRPDLTTIVIIGHITPRQARAAIEHYFGQWQTPAPPPALDLPQRPDNSHSMAYIDNRSAQQSLVALAESIPLSIHHPDHYYLDLGNAVLNGGFAGRFYKQLRMNTGYVYFINGEFAWNRTRAGYIIQYGTEPKHVAIARTVALNELVKMQTRPVSQAELQTAKAYLLRRIVLDRASVINMAAQYLDDAALGIPLNASARSGRMYAGASASQIQQAFRTWLRVPDMAEVVQGPPLAKP